MPADDRASSYFRNINFINLIFHRRNNILSVNITSRSSHTLIYLMPLLALMLYATYVQAGLQFSLSERRLKKRI